MAHIHEQARRSVRRGVLAKANAADEPPQDPLARLQWGWGSAYQITGAADRWVAQRVDNGQLIVGGSPMSWAKC